MKRIAPLLLRLVFPGLALSTLLFSPLARLAGAQCPISCNG